MIHTTEQLIDKIGEELIWRRKELTDLKGLVNSFKNDSLRSRMLTRAAVALLYAHWEGFVKQSSALYLEYVASQRLPYKKLSSNFVGLVLKSKYDALGVSEKISGGNTLANFFCTELDSKSNVPYKQGVDTKSNLSSKALIDILDALGLDITHFESRLKFIDSNLVNTRNHIAHGKERYLTTEEYLDLHDAVLTLIETYKNEIENASVSRRFERSTL
jgi:hypothetical protein